jgi:hypothetical protein
MALPARHEMLLQDRQASGAEEWWCPDCGRRLVLRWPPAYAKVVLARGDERAEHTGGTGQVHLGPLAVAPGA